MDCAIYVDFDETLISGFETTNESEIELKNKLRNIRKFFKNKKLSQKLSNKVTKYIEFLFSEKENKISISIYTEGHVLYSSFMNTKELMQNNINKNSTGIGISNLKRRLELLYAGKHKLITNIENEFYETSLIIDLS